MQKDSVRAFKNELRNYTYYLSRQVTLERAIEFTYDLLGGVRGVDPSREPLHTMPDPDREWQLRDEIDRYEAELARYRAKSCEIETVLGKMETSLKQAVMAVYVHGEHMDKVGREMSLSPNGLSKRINKAIEMALEDL